MRPWVSRGFIRGQATPEADQLLNDVAAGATVIKGLVVFGNGECPFKRSNAATG